VHTIRDLLIDIEPKTAPHWFYRKPRKPEKSVGFRYKIQFLKFREKIENQAVFLVYQLVFQFTNQFSAGF
jgi:hypothetical protein